MHILHFWKNWAVVYQRILTAIAFVFVASLAIAIFALSRYPAPLFGWQQAQELQQEKIPIYSFETGGFDLTVFTNNYVLFERWGGRPLEINIMALDLYLLFFSVAMVMLFAIITVLPRYWFLAMSGIALFMISNFQLQGLNILGLPERVPTILAMILLLGPCLYFQFINKSPSFLIRVLTFALAGSIFGASIGYATGELQPLRYFAAHTLPASFVLVVIFIVMVAHEIMAAFVSLVAGARSSRNLQHYLFISLFYLLNLWMCYATKIGWLDWGFIIHPLLLLATSGVLAVWGIRQRQPQYENILSADPFAVYFIVALGTIVSSTVGYLLGSSSDVALRSLNLLILYAHIGYGMVFLMYMASNFMGMFSKNLPVQRVLYKPTSMPYFTFRLAGLIFTIALLVYNSWMGPLNNFISTYYTSIGDLYAYEGSSTLALGYYKRAHFYTSYNQHAATALAALEAERKKPANEKGFLDDANKFKPTEFTLLNKANFLYSYHKVMEEILCLQDAKQRLPESGVVRNNLALAYTNLGLNDSAYIYFSKARENALTRASAEMNLLGLIAKSKEVINVDSLFQTLPSSSTEIKSNALAVANRLQKLVEVPIEFPGDSILDLLSATVIGNYITNHLQKTDTALLTKSVAIARKAENQPYHEMILVPAANAYYAAGHVNQAFQLLSEVIANGSNQGTHNTTLGLWSIAQGKPEMALIHLQFALEQESTQAILAYAIAIVEAGNVSASITAWDTLRRRKNPITRAMAENMVQVLQCPPSSFSSLHEKEKYQYLRYRVPLEDSLQFERLVNQITNEDLRAKAILDRARKWFSLDEAGRASGYYRKLQGLHLTDVRLFDDIKYFELHLFASLGQWEKLAEQMKKGITFGPYREGERIYFNALLYYVSGDTVNSSKAFQWLADNNDYFDEGIVTAAAFFKRDTTNNLKVYTMLAEALQVNQHAVKILKAYVLMANQLGYHDYTSSALSTLQPLISPSTFRKFVIKNQLAESILQ